jgi:hypothetical protein
MNRIKKLLKSYESYIKVPWRQDAAAAQRVIFCIYDQDDEVKLRLMIDEFGMVTRAAGYLWVEFDLTDTFADWLSGQRYAQSYFEKPHLLTTVMPKYLDYLVKEFEQLLLDKPVSEFTVVALKGVGSLFGFIKVRNLVDRLAPMVTGRLLVLFPGSYDNNNYYLLGGHDGWNYLAVPLTADKDI